MIVTCEECSTSFQLDEARIPMSGARVRCSRCKHAFFLAHPDASPEQAADAIAEDAVTDPMAGVPSSSSDPAAAGQTNPPAGSSEAEPEEEDWQFSEEIRIEGDDESAPGEDFGPPADFGDGLDADGMMHGDPGVGSDLHGTESQFSGQDVENPSGLELDGVEPSNSLGEFDRDESNFGSVDDFSSLMEDDEVGSPDPGLETDAELADARETSPAAGTYAASGATDDLGDPESWDLVGSDDFSVSKPTADLMAAPFLAGGVGGAAGVAEELEESVYEEEVESTSRVAHMAGTLGRGLGWTATIAAVGAVLALGFQAEWNRWLEAPQVVTAGALTVEATRARWVETSRSGVVLLVEGEIRNTGAEALRPASIQLALLDEHGEQIASSPVEVGARLEERILREAPPAELLARSASAAHALRASPLSPGERRAFEAVLLGSEIPEQARRFLLQIVEGAPVAADPGIENEAPAVDRAPIAEGADSGGSGRPEDAGSSIDGTLESAGSAIPAN